MTRRAAIGVALVLIAAPAFGMGSFGGGHHGHQPKGPHLYCQSENAEEYIVSIDGIDYVIPAESDSSLWMDLHEFISAVGTYDITVQPTNESGDAPELYFQILILSSKKYMTWIIEPDAIQAKEHPEYLDAFSNDLEVRIPKR